MKSNIMMLVFALIMGIIPIVSCNKEQEPTSKDVFVQLELPSGVKVPAIFRICKYDSLSNYTGQSFITGLSGMMTIRVDEKMLIYNFDLESTEVKDDGNYNELSFVTTPMQGKKIRIAGSSVSVSNNPDIIYTGMAKSDFAKDTIIIKCERFTKDNELTLTGVKGIENLSSCIVYISGQSEGMKMVSKKTCGDEVVLCDSCFWHKEDNTLKTTINTFGTAATAKDIYMRVEFTDIAGLEHLVNMNISSFYNASGNTVVPVDYEIPKPETREGGMLPVIGEWNDVVTTVNMGQR